MVGIYWAVLYTLQSESPLSLRLHIPPRCRLWTWTNGIVGFCLTLLLVRKDVTKETLVNGVGLRFAIANWLQAAWAVCFVSPHLAQHHTQMFQCIALVACLLNCLVDSPVLYRS